MYKKTTLALLCSCASLSILSTTSLAAPVNARTDAMGGAGVAVAEYYAAPLYNPALITSYDETDDFALSINLGLGVDGDAELVDDLEDFSDAFDVFTENLDELDEYIDAGDYDQSQADILQADLILSQYNLADSLDALDGQQINIDFGANLVMAIPNSYASAALFIDMSAVMVGLTDMEGDDIRDIDLSDVENLPDSDEVEDEIESEITFLTGAMLDAGITLGHSFQLSPETAFGASSIDVGISPKMKNLAVYQYRVNANSFDDDDTFDEDDVIEDSAFNLDLGATYNFENWRIGVVLKDLLSQELETEEVLSSDNELVSYQFEVKPQLSIGGGYLGSWYTVALDVELTERSGFKGVEMPQFASFGVELNAFDWAQLRAGYKTDIAGVYEDRISAGLGLSPFGVLHLDIGAAYASDTEFAANVQLAFTF